MFLSRLPWQSRLLLPSGFQNQDYTFKVVVQTGQAISGYELAQITDPANDNGVVAFLATMTDGSQAIIEATKRWR
jgi:hypothetical protein